MRPTFREDKTTQAAALLLKLRGGSMNYMKLIKILYLADREALLRFGQPITFDAYVSMDHGPVLSRTLNLINEGLPPGLPSMWRDCISGPENYEVRQVAECGTDALSQAEIELLEETFHKFGSLDRWQLVELVHDLPEWCDPQGSAIPISYHDILLGSGKTEIEAAEIEYDLEQLAAADRILG